MAVGSSAVGLLHEARLEAVVGAPVVWTQLLHVPPAVLLELLDQGLPRSGATSRTSVVEHLLQRGIGVVFVPAPGQAPRARYSSSTISRVVARYRPEAPRRARTAPKRAARPLALARARAPPASAVAGSRTMRPSQLVGWCHRSMSNMKSSWARVSHAIVVLPMFMKVPGLAHGVPSPDKARP